MNELSEGQIALQLATGFNCLHCLDTRLTQAGAPCFQCPFVFYASENAARQLAQAVVQRERDGLSLETDFQCARALVRATIQRPVRNTTLGLFLSLGEREVKATIQVLRDEWHLPIGSLRVPPYGYYWISTPEEFLAWFGPMKGQALSELRTAHRMMRRHFPALAGQFKFDFEEEVSQ